MKGFNMSEQTQAPVTPAVPATPTTPTAPAPVTMPTQAAQTSTAAAIDINSIISQAEAKASEAAEKKMTGVFKSMLEQQGLDTETINKMTAEFKAKQQTPEQIAAEKDGTITGLTNDNLKLQRQLAAIGKGVPADKSDKYIALAQSYLGDDGDFGKALDAALADFPIPAQNNPAPAPVPQLPVGVSIFQPDGNRSSSATFTAEQIKSMTPAQINANWDNVKKTLNQKG